VSAWNVQKKFILSLFAVLEADPSFASSVSITYLTLPQKEKPGQTPHKTKKEKTTKTHQLRHQPPPVRSQPMTRSNQLACSASGKGNIAIRFEWDIVPP
jgi:hypothetical protein